MKTVRQNTMVAVTTVVSVVLILGAAGNGLSALPGSSSAGTISAERNKATARRWSEELWGQGKLAVADEIIARGYVRHDSGDPFPAHGPDDVKRIVSVLRSMLPDFAIHVDATIAEGDLVVSRYTATATDTVGYMGMPPTGKSLRTTAMQMFRFKDGLIVESWAVRDDLGTLRQLGHLPPSPVHR